MEIQVSKLTEMLNNGDKITLIDVREPSEHESEHIENSILIPLSRLDTSKINPSDKIVIYCKSGRRGSSALDKIKKDLPNIEIFNLSGGISAWIEAGNSVIRGKKCMPLDQQVHTIVGFCILICSILAYKYNINFIFVPMLFGAGLLFAGLTGFCGLAMLLARMPWNACTKGATSCKTSCCK